jgi:hypothetical protein
MTIHSARNAVSAAELLQPALHADRPGYFVAGAGTPVVMLHSSLSSKSQWGALAERLSIKRRRPQHRDRNLPSAIANSVRATLFRRSAQ